MKVQHFELHHVSDCNQYKTHTLLHASMCLWRPIVPLCMYMYHLWYPVPDCYLLKYLWAAPCGFLSLKDLVVLNVDCHDVSSKPQLCLLCVTVNIYFRPVCEKQLSFHLCNSLTWTVGLNTTLLLVGQNRHPNGCAR